MHVMYCPLFNTVPKIASRNKSYFKKDLAQHPDGAKTPVSIEMRPCNAKVLGLRFHVKAASSKSPLRFKPV